MLNMIVGSDIIPGSSAPFQNDRSWPQHDIPFRSCVGLEAVIYRKEKIKYLKFGVSDKALC